MNNSTECQSVFSESQLEVLGLSQGIAAILSILGCVFIFSLMLIFKKYIYSSQRLLIYLTIAVLLVSISFVIRGLGYSLINNSDFCMGVAFIGQYSGGCILAAVTCLIVDIFVHAVLRKDKWNIEPVYVLCIFIIPALVDWLPFIKHAYGPTKGWCWIRAHDLNTCQPFLYGLILQYVLWYIPSITVMVTGGIIYVISLIAISRYNHRYSALIELDRNYLQKAATNEIKHYRWYPLLYLLINIIPLATRIISDASPNTYIFPLWVVSAIIQGLQGGFVAILFALDAETRKRLSWGEIRNGVKYNILRFEDTQEYSARREDSEGQNITDSLRKGECDDKSFVTEYGRIK